MLKITEGRSSGRSRIRINNKQNYWKYKKKKKKQVDLLEVQDEEAEIRKAFLFFSTAARFGFSIIQIKPALAPEEGARADGFCGRTLA